MSRFPSRISRRALLAGAAATACGHKPGKRYQGWLLVASGAEKALAVADLAEFRRVTTIPLPAAPDQLHYSSAGLITTSSAGAALFVIDPVSLRLAAKIGLNGRPAAARLFPDQQSALIALDDPASLVAVDLSRRRVSARLPLPAAAADLDLNDHRAALTIPTRNSVVRISIPRWRIEGMSAIEGRPTPVRFRKDGRVILTGAPAVRQVVSIDADSGALLARLPVPIAPSRFCFNPDGGQMFITGDGEDTVAIVSPYQNEVDETILAGRTPHAMAVSEKNNLLFVTNFESGDLTILDIDSRRLSASVHVGDNPSEVLITPGGEYALVLDRRSGNVSVVRVSTVLDHKVRTKPLFTVFPTATDARSAVIVPFQT